MFDSVRLSTLNDFERHTFLRSTPTVISRTTRWFMARYDNIDKLRVLYIPGSENELGSPSLNRLMIAANEKRIEFIRWICRNSINEITNKRSINQQNVQPHKWASQLWENIFPLWFTQLIKAMTRYDEYADWIGTIVPSLRESYIWLRAKRTRMGMNKIISKHLHRFRRSNLISVVERCEQNMPRNISALQLNRTHTHMMIWCR